MDDIDGGTPIEFIARPSIAKAKLTKRQKGQKTTGYGVAETVKLNESVKPSATLFPTDSDSGTAIDFSSQAETSSVLKLQTSKPKLKKRDW